MSLYKKPGSPYWWISISPRDGARIRKPTSVRHDAPTPELRKRNKELATVELHRAYTAAAERKVFGAKREAITFAAYVKWYGQHLNAPKKGADQASPRLARFVQHFGTMPLASITREDVQEYQTARRASVKQITVWTELSILRHVFNSAIPKYLETSPMAGMKLQRGPTLERVVLTKPDEAKLLPHLPPADRVLVIAAIDTIVRAGDLLKLTWADDKGTYFVVKDPKSGRLYRPPISTRLRAALDAYRDGAPASALIFPRRHPKKRPSKDMPYMLQRACKKAGLPYGRKNGAFDFHSLRHTGATRFLDAGGTLRELMTFGNWHDMRHLTTYTHATEDAIRARVEDIGRGVTPAVTAD